MHPAQKPHHHHLQLRSRSGPCPLPWCCDQTHVHEENHYELQKKQPLATNTAFRFSWALLVIACPTIYSPRRAFCQKLSSCLLTTKPLATCTLGLLKARIKRPRLSGSSSVSASTQTKMSVSI